MVATWFREPLYPRSSKASPVYEVANTLGLDFHTLGNHEFDYGWRKD